MHILRVACQAPFSQAKSPESLRSQVIPEVQEEVNEETRLAPLYRVIIHNDDVTPMDFVMHILREVFLLSGIHALQVMYTAHYHGTALVDVLPKIDAQRKVGRAHYSARLRGFPLQFTIEPDQ